MFKKLKYSLIAAMMVSVLAPATGFFSNNLLLTNIAYAAEPVVIEEPAKDPALDCTSGSGDTCDLVAKYINPFIIFLSAGVGLAVTIGLIAGGMQYASAGGDPGKVQKAKATIRASIVALLVFLFLWALLRWLQPGGVV